MKRIFEHYGRNPPDAAWPGGARLALNFVINHEEGGERSVPDGDPHSENALTEGSTGLPKGRDLAAESMFQYGSRVGFWRLHGLFTRAGLPCTIFAVAQSLQRTPEAAAAIREAGWDVVGHGLRWESHADMDEATERHALTEATRIIEATTGHRPQGWYCRYAPSLNTRRILRELGYNYDSDAYDDELPYWDDGHLVIPYTLVNNDVRFQRAAITTGEDFFTYIMGGIEMALSEPGARMMSVGLHNRIIGHPARAIGLKRILDAVKTMPEVWVCRRLDIAEHWMKHHAP